MGAICGGYIYVQWGGLCITAAYMGGSRKL